ncbi:MAG: stage II sporulation protein R [Clostridiaceae bacterium]|nr:stage II sporulation protein R [Clostridiaceae bacterium]
MKTLLSIICSKKVKNSLILLILLFIYIYISAFSYVNAVSRDISNSVFRLHVIANSDSKEDQELKYKVRDDLIEYMNTLCSNINSKDEAIEIARSHKEDFISIAKSTIINNGYNYDVDVEIGNFSFPTKDYGDISLPTGFYDALRVKIGEAKGQNWWCVMFPPLCFVNISSGIVPDESKELIQDDLNDEEYSIIVKENNSEIQFKLGLIEWFMNHDLLTAKK